MRTFGLIGKKLGHSFSKKYFSEKFKSENIEEVEYKLFEIAQIDEFPGLIRSEKPAGLNVTIPFKEEVIPFLDHLDSSAKKVGAVNVILCRDQLIGYNSDYFGFKSSLENWLPNDRKWKALVLGSGGASKAVCAALKDLGIRHLVVSRTKGDINYQNVSKDRLISEYQLIINTTPLGMYPDIDACPEIDYTLLTDRHFLYDLVYNPEKTRFLAEGEKRGARTKGGLEMLHLQAEKSWEIWNS